MTHSFPITENLIHLNHAAVGSWPQCTADAVTAFALENARQGSQNYLQWMQVENDLRDRLKRLINAASVDEIALVKNTSEGLSLIAAGLSWKSGDNVVGIQQEFPSNRFVWDALANQGVEFRKLDLEQVDDPEQGLFDLCDAHTRLIAVSAVQYATGLRMDLARIGDFCRARNILFCIDAIQQIGMLPFDVQAVGADFAVADGHKWMLAPEGVGLMYLRAEVMEQVAVHQYGWHMAQFEDYSQQKFELKSDARRFECGSPNTLGIHALHSSLGLILEQGMNSIGEQVLARADYLVQGLNRIDGLNVLSDTREHRKSAIVSFAKSGVESQALYRYLQQNNVLCAPRGGGVRLSPHYYVPFEQLDVALNLISGFEG